MKDRVFQYDSSHRHQTKDRFRITPSDEHSDDRVTLSN